MDTQPSDAPPAPSPAETVGLPAPAEDGSAAERDYIKALPKEVGVLLMVVGIGGLLLPGPVGTPFVLLGGVVLWPRVFERVERAFERRCPRLHRESMKQFRRYMSDLERRYPPGG